MPTKPLLERGVASLKPVPVPSGFALFARRLAGAVRRPVRVPVAGALVAAVLCSAAHAGDPAEEAVSLIAQQRHDEAREVLDSLLERDPEAPGVRLLLGVLSAREGNYPEAISVFEDLRGDFPDMFETHNNLAVLYAETGRLDDARGALIAALKLRPDAVVYANLGDVYTRLAQRAYARARQLSADPDAALSPDATAEPAPELPAVLVDAAAADEGEGAAADEQVVVEPAESAEAVSAEAEQPPPEAEEAESTAAPEQPPARPAAEECALAGDFADLAGATEAVAWIRSQGAGLAETRRGEREEIKNYRVYWPALESREAARAKASEFRSAGAGDVAVIGKGPLTNAVSFGLFRSESNMRRRVAGLEKLGISASAEANLRVVDRYTIEARVEGDRAAFDEAWARRFPDIPIRHGACTAGPD